MFASLTAAVAIAASFITAEGAAIKRGTGIYVTPHVEYSSSVGVLGCKINTNRVAYWPSSVGCDNICVRVTHTESGRTLNLLKIDQSGGAYDISYDAWNYLSSGKSATESPQMGGGVAMTYEDVPASECAGLINTPSQKLPLTAANSMNYVASCISQPSSWVAQNYEMYNILDPICHWGVDEVCSLDLNVSNQPTCPHTLGVTTPLNLPVTNIEYGTGKPVAA
ncbi:hypothetical protein V2G26_002975 [Clonostachys chloroleuca]